MKPSSLTIRAAVDPNIAQQVWLKAVKDKPTAYPWAKEVELLGERYVVGQAVVEYYTVFPIPFDGHVEDWEVIKPIRNADDLLRQLKGE